MTFKIQTFGTSAFTSRMTRFSILAASAITLCFSSAEAAGLYSVTQDTQGVAPSIHVDVSDQIVSGAQTFVSSMAARGIGFLGNKSLNQDQRRMEFEKLLHDSFDMQTISRLALGRYWRTASVSQRKEYQNLFEDMIVDVYSRRFGEYDGQKLEVRSAKKAGKSDVNVVSYIVPASGPEIEVVWRARYDNGQYKVIDVIVEGVSMVLTQRSDFSSVIQRGGGSLDVLIEHLRG